ncbi:MAG: hypothetical protein RJA83_676 [Pseudomonadota bacterium]|jgi:hypothetical protein
MNTQPKRIKYIALQDWDKHHDFPSIKHFRKLLQSASRNGLDKIVRKVGGLIVIKEDEFFEWVEQQPYECFEDRKKMAKVRPKRINTKLNKEEDQSTG